MSVKAMTQVWEHAPVKGAELLTLLVIADHADDHGANAWPSNARLTHRTRLDRRSVQRIIGRLEAAALLTVERNAGPGNTNRYTITLPATTTPAPANTPPEPVDTPPAPVDNPADAVDKSAGSVDNGGGVLPPWQNAAAVSGSPAGRSLGHPPGGTAMPPKPPRTSLTSSSPPPPGQPPAAGVDGGGGHPQVDAVLDALGAQWPLTAGQRSRLADPVTAALTAGWTRTALVEHLRANPDGVRAPAAVLAARLADLPAPHTNGRVAADRTQWCGSCDRPDYRWIELPDGRWTHCPRCHPGRASPEVEDPGRSKPPSTHRPGSVPSHLGTTPAKEHPQCPPQPVATRT